MPNYTSLTNQGYYDLLIENRMEPEEIIASQFNKILILATKYNISLNDKKFGFKSGQNSFLKEQQTNRLKDFCNQIEFFLKHSLLHEDIYKNILTPQKSAASLKVKVELQTLKTIRVLIEIAAENIEATDLRGTYFNRTQAESSQHKEETYWNQYKEAIAKEYLTETFPKYTSLTTLINDNDDTDMEEDDLKVVNNNNTAVFSKPKKSLTEKIKNKKNIEADNLLTSSVNSPSNHNKIISKVATPTGHRIIVLYENGQYCIENSAPLNAQVDTPVIQPPLVQPPANLPPPPPPPPVFKQVPQKLIINRAPFKWVSMLQEGETINKIKKDKKVTKVKIHRGEDIVDVQRTTALLEFVNNEPCLTYYDAKESEFISINTATYLSDNEQSQIIDALKNKQINKELSPHFFAIISKKWTAKNQETKQQIEVKKTVEISIADVQKNALERKKRVFISPSSQKKQPQEDLSSQQTRNITTPPKGTQVSKTETPEFKKKLKTLGRGESNQQKITLSNSPRQIEYRNNRNILTPKKNLNAEKATTPEFIKKRNNLVNVHSPKKQEFYQKVAAQKNKSNKEALAHPVSPSCSLNNQKANFINTRSPLASEKSQAVHFQSLKKVNVENNNNNSNIQNLNQRSGFGNK